MCLTIPPRRRLVKKANRADRADKAAGSSAVRMPTFGAKHKHSLSAGGALRQLIDMTTLISPTQGGFHKPKDPDHLDSAVDSTMAICGGFQPHIVRIYQDLCGPGQALLSADRFADFLERTQCEEAVVRPMDRETYTLQQFFEVWSYTYRLKPLRKVDPEQKDLSRPISHYFINSSHNTYLLGNQLTSASSVDAYTTALEQDCRCIEIDVWNAVNWGPRTPNRSRSPHPGHKRHMSASSVVSVVEETFKGLILGKSTSKDRSPSAGRSNNLEVPSSHASQATLVPNGDPAASTATAAASTAAAVPAPAPATTTPTEAESGEAGPEDNVRKSRLRSRSIVDPSMEPVVMHGHTYVQRDWTLGNPIGFRDVCRAVRRSAFTHNHLPIIISLEVHADPPQQDVMVEIMREEWGDHLLDEAFVGCDPRLRLPRLEELMDKILIKVKKASVIADSNGTADSLGIPLQALKQKQQREPSIGGGGCGGSSSSDDEGGGNAKKPRISKRLSSLAVYTHSKHLGSFSDRVAKSPSHIFSLSEASIRRWQREDPKGMAAHNRSFLMRAYPDPVAHVDSGNMDPSALWRKGVQMVAMNWQTLDSGMMLNHAMFADQAGWALKPPALRVAANGGGAGAGGEELLLAPVAITSLKVTIFAGQNLPPIKGKSPISFDPCVKVDMHIEGKEDPIKRVVPERNTSHPDWGPDGHTVVFKDVANVIEEFSFLKFRVEDDSSLSSWACYRLDRLRQGYRFIDLLGLRGERTEGRLLVKIEKLTR